jgi:hypothetical protein
MWAYSILNEDLTVQTFSGCYHDSMPKCPGAPLPRFETPDLVEAILAMAPHFISLSRYLITKIGI